MADYPGFYQNYPTGYGWQQGTGANSMTWGTPIKPIKPSAGGAAGAGYGNAYTQAATDYLSKVLSGKELPYDKTTRANMLSEQSGMAAAAETARNQEVNDSALAGGSGYNDPSLRGFRASSMARRQSDNMGAARDIAQNANVQNFQAKEGAARALATFGLAEEDRRLQAMKDWMGTGASQSRPTVANGLGMGYTLDSPFPQQQYTPYNYPSQNPYSPVVKPKPTNR